MANDKHRCDREIRDAVHGFVKLSQAEIDIINTGPFQRLRDIRQLAMGHMVYPGAVHTRFEHSLGCVHLASAMLDLIVERQGKGGTPSFADAFSADEDAVQRGRKILRLAALLHDVGHPPFSHSGEKVLPEGIDHEQMTARIIRESEIAEVVRAHFDSAGITVEDVVAVSTKPDLATDRAKRTPWNAFLNQILTGELGADRIDYLLRDAHHSGQRSGAFDHLKLMNALTLIEPPENEEPDVRLGLDEGGWLVAEQMVVARYLMYIALYFHKTKCIYEKHMEDFMRAWLPGEGRLPSNREEYLSYSDSRVLSAIAERAREQEAPGHEHACRFFNRSHLRLAREVVLADNHRIEKERRVPDLPRFDRLGKAVSIKFGTQGVILQDSRRHSATKMFTPDSRILVQLDGRPRSLDDVSEIVRGMSSTIWRGRVYCEKGHKHAIRAFCDQWLSDSAVEANRESTSGTGTTGKGE